MHGQGSRLQLKFLIRDHKLFSDKIHIYILIFFYFYFLSEYLSSPDHGLGDFFAKLFLQFLKYNLCLHHHMFEVQNFQNCLGRSSFSRCYSLLFEHSVFFVGVRVTKLLYTKLSNRKDNFIIFIDLKLDWFRNYKLRTWNNTFMVVLEYVVENPFNVIPSMSVSESILIHGWTWIEQLSDNAIIIMQPR